MFVSNPITGGRGVSPERRAGLLLAIVATLALSAWAGVRTEQIAVEHWTSSCLHITEVSFAEAPLKDGEPDYSKVMVHGLKIDKGCGMIEVHRTK
jgi:hypothetical protein